MANPTGTIVNTLFTPSVSSLSRFKTPLIIFFGLAIIGVIAFVIKTIKGNKEKWNIQIRLRQEDTENHKIPIDSIIIRAKRVTLKNGVRLIYLEKSILGKRLLPLLNYYTRPGVYDLLLTADNRLLIIEGINGIDEQRKLLNVGIRNPGIDHQFDEVNQKYAKMNRVDKRNDILEMVKYATMGVIAIVILVGFIVGGKYWIQSKQVDKQIKQSELQFIESSKEISKLNLEVVNSLNIFIQRYENSNGNGSIKRDINALSSVT